MEEATPALEARRVALAGESDGSEQPLQPRRVPWFQRPEFRAAEEPSRSAASQQPADPPKLFRRLALDLFDWLWIFGCRPASFAEWRARFAKRDCFNTAQSKWRRLRDQLERYQVPHEKLLLPSLDEEGGPDRIHVRLQPAARQVVNDALPPIRYESQ